MPISAKLSQLLITPEENEKSVTSVYISEPTPLEEKNLGTVFSIINIESQDTTAQEVINLINEEITQNYYRSSDLEIEIAFENTLHLLNKKLQKVTAELGEEWIKDLNIVVAVLKDKNLYFTQTGAINILLAQKNKVIKLDEDKYTTPNPLKILSNIASGQLTNSSAVIFCTESILDYLSQEKIKKTISENDPPEAARYLQELLHENSNATNFAAIIIKILPSEAVVENATKTPQERIEKSSFVEEQKKDSMDKLISKEVTTDELLSPSIWPRVKKNVQEWKDKMAPVKIKQPESEKTTEAAEVKKESVPEIGQEKNKALDISKKILVILKNLGIQILNGLAWLFRFIIDLFKQPKQYSSKFSSIPNKAESKVAKSINWFKGLSTPAKAFIVLFIIIIFVFSQSIIRQGKKQEQWQETQQYEQAMSDINNKLGEAETKIIMNDFAGSRTLVNEVVKLKGAIPEDSKIWEEQGADANSKLQSILDQVNYINRLPEPTSVATYSASVDKIAAISTNIFAFDQNNNSVYRYDLEASEATTSVADETTNKFRAITKDSAATVLAVLEDQTFYQFNPVLEKLSETSIEFPNQDTGITDLKTFGTRLYTLDTKNNQIFKSTQSGDEYSEAEAWLVDENVNVNNGRSFAIDGAIFLLKDEGKVIRLFGGEKDGEWGLEELQPNLAGATKIYTDENTANLYILDPAEKRVVIYDKEGTLQEQYTSDKWGDLKDLVVEENNSRMYLLNGSEVFEVDLN